MRGVAEVRGVGYRRIRFGCDGREDDRESEPLTSSVAGFCGRCGEPLASGANFCRECGAEVPRADAGGSTFRSTYGSYGAGGSDIDSAEDEPASVGRRTGALFITFLGPNIVNVIPVLGWIVGFGLSIWSLILYRRGQDLGARVLRDACCSRYRGSRRVLPHVDARSGCRFS